ncbi:MAG: universal stress protein [Marmoricola sp.]
MNPTRPIVIGYDASPDSEIALAWCLQTAALMHASVRVVVATMPRGELPAHLRDYEEDFARSAASAARDQVKVQPEVDATVVVEQGWPLPVLLRSGRGARMLVVGSRGHNRFENHWAGSVSQHLAGHAECPVAVIRPQANPRADRILVGIDGSPSSIRALDFAARRAELTGEAVLAVHAYPTLTYGGGGLGALAMDMNSADIDSAERLAVELVAGIAVDHPDVPLRSTAVMGRPAKVLTRFSDDVSLLVIGSRGRTPVHELLLGSVSQETLHRAACPVVVVR